MITQTASETGAVAAGALDADEHDPAERADPGRQFDIAGRLGAELTSAEQATDRIENRDVVSLAVGVHSRDDIDHQRSSDVPSRLLETVDDHRPADGQDGEGLKQGPMRSRCLYRCRPNDRDSARPTDHKQGIQEQWSRVKTKVRPSTIATVPILTVKTRRGAEF